MPLSARSADEAADLDDAIEIAQLLARTLDMPQRPDAMTITDANGTMLYSGVLSAAAINEGKAIAMKRLQQ